MDDLWSVDWSNAEVDDGDIYKMVTPQLIKCAASHAEIVFADLSEWWNKLLYMTLIIQHRTTVNHTTTKRNPNHIYGNTVHIQDPKQINNY